MVGLGISGCHQLEGIRKSSKITHSCEVRKAFSCLAMSSSLGQDLGLRLLGPSHWGRRVGGELLWAHVFFFMKDFRDIIYMVIYSGYIYGEFSI